MLMASTYLRNRHLKGHYTGIFPTTTALPIVRLEPCARDDTRLSNGSRRTQQNSTTSNPIQAKPPISVLSNPSKPRNSCIKCNPGGTRLVHVCPALIQTILPHQAIADKSKMTAIRTPGRYIYCPLSAKQMGDYSWIFGFVCRHDP